MKNVVCLALFLLTALGTHGQSCLTVTCSSNKTVSCDDTNWTFDPPAVSNCAACGGDRGYSIYVLSTVTSGHCPQLITRTWQVTNSCADSAECSQTVTVVNTNQPVFANATNITVYSCTNAQVFLQSNGKRDLLWQPAGNLLAALRQFFSGGAGDLCHLHGNGLLQQHLQHAILRSRDPGARLGIVLHQQDGGLRHGLELRRAHHLPMHAAPTRITSSATLGRSPMG